MVTVEWTGGCNGNAVTLAGSGLVDADLFGAGIESPPLNDIDPGTGFAMAVSPLPGEDHNYLLGAIPTDSTPGDGADLTLPPDEALVGHTWFVRLSTVLTTEAEGFAFPTELVDHGYTLTVGLATIGEGGSLHTDGATHDIVTGTDEPELAALIATGRMAGVGLSYAFVSEEQRAAVAAGEAFPFVEINGPEHGRDPLLLVAELALLICDVVASAETLVRSVVRQFPRDDSLGLGSAPRLHPPARAGRLVGGFQ